MTETIPKLTPNDVRAISLAHHMTGSSIDPETDWTIDNPVLFTPISLGTAQVCEDGTVYLHLGVSLYIDRTRRLTEEERAAIEGAPTFEWPRRWNVDVEWSEAVERHLEPVVMLPPASALQCATRNGWKLIAYIEAGPARRDVCGARAVVICERPSTEHPDAGRVYTTHIHIGHADGTSSGLVYGHYDLTKEEALADALERLT